MTFSLMKHTDRLQLSKNGTLLFQIGEILATLFNRVLSALLFYPFNTIKMKRKQKQFVRDIVEELKPIYSVDFHEFEILWCIEDVEDKTYASMSYQDDYQSATLTIYPVFFTVSIQEQFKILIHEFNHIKSLTMKQAFIHFIGGTKSTTMTQVTEMDEKLVSSFENIIFNFIVGMPETKKRINALIKKYA